MISMVKVFPERPTERDSYGKFGFKFFFLNYLTYSVSILLQRYVLRTKLTYGKISVGDF